MSAKIKNKLSVLIPFLNEGDEVITTVQEVRRTVGYNVDIVVVNDSSTDNYNYCELLKPYEVTYIQNEKNLGSAPSRDICVEHCKTPFFLFLDAHMRFYENNWHKKLIQLLEENDRRIICGQTVCLEKNNLKKVNLIKNQRITFGAYIPLLIGNPLPDIKWNNIELHPETSLEIVPCVLGAAYAGSTRYWTHLKGMHGLKKYGCEEQFISIKTWLEGGSCYILKSFKVGHIYRKCSPYKHHSTEELYNYIFISSLFLPVSLQAKSYASVFQRLKYDEVKKIELEETFNTKKLSDYFSTIFIRDISFFLSINRNIRCEIVLNALKDKSRYIIPVCNLILKNISTNISLQHGKAGQLLWLVVYQKYIGEYQCHIKNISDKILNDIISQVIEDRNILGDSMIYADIGWMFLYLNENFNINHDKVLSIIDNRLSQKSAQSIVTYTDKYIIKIIFAYLNLRLKHHSIYGLRHFLPEHFLASLDTIVPILKRKYIYESEILNVLFLYEYARNGLFDNNATSISEVVSFKTDCPSNEKYWGCSLQDSNVSATLLFMLTKLTKNNL